MNVLKKLHNQCLDNMMKNKDTDIQENCLDLNIEEIQDLVHYINDLVLDRDAKSVEVTKYKNQILSMNFDLDVLECLYKNCCEEMMKQESTIDMLRQAYLDNHINDFNMKLDKTILQSTLMERNKSLDSCQEIFVEFDKIKEELIELASQFTNTDTENEVRCIKNQLYTLQDVLKCEEKFTTTQHNFKMNDSMTLDRECMPLKNSFQCLKSKLKNQKDINKLNKMKMQKLKKLLKVKENRTQDFMKENKHYIEKNIQLENELSFAKIQLVSLNNLLYEYQEKNIALSMKLTPLQNAYKEKENQFKIKQDCIQWLEFELNESTRKGYDVCCESKQIFTGVKKWMNLVKKERRNLILKIKDLQNINRMLTLQLKMSTLSNDYETTRGFNHS